MKKHVVFVLAAIFCLFQSELIAQICPNDTSTRYQSGVRGTRANWENLAAICDATLEGVGVTPAVAGLSSVERGIAFFRQTTIIFDEVVVQLTDAGAAGSHGTLAIYNFPEGYIQFAGHSIGVTVTAGTGGVADGADYSFGLGSSPVGTDNDTLVGAGEADIFPLGGGSAVRTLTAGVDTIAGRGFLQESFGGIDNSAGGKSLRINIAVDADDSTADDTMTVSGEMTIFWWNLGDP